MDRPGSDPSAQSPSSSPSPYFSRLPGSRRGYIAVVFVAFLSAPQVMDVKKPVVVRDAVPLLPNRISRPLLHYLQGSAAFLPKYVGSANATHGVDWKGTCFHKNNAWLEFDLHNESGSPYGGATLHIKNSDAHSFTCMDLYIFATPFKATWDYYFRSGEHKIHLVWSGQDEYDFVKQSGVSIFFMEAGLVGTAKALWKVWPLFNNVSWSEKANMDFLKEHMGATFPERPQPAWVTKNIDPNDINSGDFIALSSLRGRGGGIHTLLKWATGAFAGHAALCIRDPDHQRKLWVAESPSEGWNVGFQTWEEWWNKTMNREASSQVALLPLHADLRANFNEAAAWKFVQSMKGKPYGFENMVYSWIDTLTDNYPPPMDDHLVAAGMTILSHLRPKFASQLWKESLNKRLRTHGLEIPEIMAECERRGLKFGTLLSVPEEDDWEYSTGKAVTCISFVVQIYKAAGMFGPITNNIQATEFTVKDGYMLNFYETEQERLPKWCNEGDTVKMGYCQILGKYRLALPGFNSLKPYSFMNERCPSVPPYYDRPHNC